MADTTDDTGFRYFELETDPRMRRAASEEETAMPEFLDLMGTWFDAPDEFPREFSAFREFSSVPGRCRGAVVAIGKFDGVHVGHKALIDEAAAKANELSVPLGVLTFEPHPRAVFEPESEPFLLANPESRARTMAELGVDVLLAQSFDKEFASLEPDDFVRQVLVEGMRVSHVVVGHDFRFGRKRAGDANMLRTMGQEFGFGVSVIEAVTVDGDTAGSTRVRRLIEQGRPRAAARVLGRMWEIEGRLEHGSNQDSRDRPTVSLASYQTPAPGWYAVMMARQGEREPGWLSLRGEVNARAGHVALSDMPADTLLRWRGRDVRVAFVEYLGSQPDAVESPPLEKDG